MKISEFFKENSGKLSNTRLNGTLLLVAILFNWSWYNVHHDTLAGFGATELAIIAAVLGTNVVKSFKPSEK